MRKLLLLSTFVLFVGCSAEQIAKFEVDLADLESEVAKVADNAKSVRMAAETFLPMEVNGVITLALALLAGAGGTKVLSDKRNKKKAEKEKAVVAEVVAAVKAEDARP